jgi:hypothetical protein
MTATEIHVIVLESKVDTQSNVMTVAKNGERMPSIIIVWIIPPIPSRTIGLVIGLPEIIVNHRRSHINRFVNIVGSI